MFVITENIMKRPVYINIFFSIDYLVSKLSPSHTFFETVNIRTHETLRPPVFCMGVKRGLLWGKDLDSTHTQKKGGTEQNNYIIKRMKRRR